MCGSKAYKAPAVKPLPPPPPGATPGQLAPLINEGFGFVGKIAALQATRTNVVPFKMPLNPYISNVEQLARQRSAFVNSLTTATANRWDSGQAPLTPEESEQVDLNTIARQDEQDALSGNRRGKYNRHRVN